MKETEFSRRLSKALREVEAQVLVLKPDMTMGKGWPDLFVAHRSWTGWIELKVKGFKLSPAQTQRIDLLRRQDCAVKVLRLVDGVVYEELEGRQWRVCALDDALARPGWFLRLLDAE